MHVWMPCHVLVCDMCHRMHNLAHRCPVRRFDSSLWIHPPFDVVLPAVPVHMLPACDVVCPHCHARSWPDEHISCCGKGRLTLPIDEAVPAEFQDVILSAHVRSHIRRCSAYDD